MPTHLCAISFKECWQDPSGAWMSDGGFPLQMAALGSMFDEMTLLVTRRRRPGGGAIPLPRNARVVLLRRPTGDDRRRKASVLAFLPHYLATMARHARRADVVHVPLPGDLPLLGMLVAWALRRRLLVRYCGPWGVSPRTSRAGRVTQALMRRLAGGVDRSTPGSAVGGRHVMLVTGMGTSRPAPGLHWIFATALSAAELGGSPADCRRGLQSPPRIVCVGRLSPEKGLLDLVEALAILREVGLSPLPRVSFIGDGPQRAALERRIRALGCEELCHFTGQLDRPALVGALAGADLCVHPSHAEGFCKAWLDAFACGLPVIASNVGAARSVMGADGERGWLVSPGDVPALAARLREVLSSPRDWMGLRQRCRAYVEDRTLEAWAAEIGRICATQWNMALIEGKLRP
jgi:glycosyltransferase involved in cell wall biosynthesis